MLFVVLAGPSTPSHVASRVPPTPEPAPRANAITSQCNLLTLNAITDLPSSDSNNSLDNSSFVYSRREPSHTNKSSCFKTRVEPFEADHFYERKTAESTRLSYESNQSLLYRYPADNDYNLRPATATATTNASSNASADRSSDSEFLYAEKQGPQHPSKGSSIHEYQPRHHQQPAPASSIYLTTASAQKKPQKGHSQGSSSRRVSPSTSHSTSHSTASPRSPQPANSRSDSRTDHASRYINSSSIETPI